MSIETTRCVVLNSTYEPISIIKSKRALILVLEGTATVVEEHPELVVRSPSTTFNLPTMIVLKQFVRARRFFNTPATLTQRNLFRRDNNTCQYCGRHKNQLKSSEFLTRDHITPECRGGQNTWENLVTACSTCNNKKADYNLSDTNLRLLKIPQRPTIFELWQRERFK